MGLNYHVGRLITRLGFTLLPTYKIPKNNGNLLEYILKMPDTQKRIKTLIQIGGYDGDYEDPLKKALNKQNKAKIFIIEPQEKCVKVLEKKYRLNTNVKIIPVAISNINKKSFIFIPEKNEVSPIASLSKNHSKRFAIDNVKEVPVVCMTLKTVLKNYKIRNPEIFIIDAEGLESVILRQIIKLKKLPFIIYFEHLHLTKSEKEKIRELFSSYIRVETEQDTLLIRK